MEPDTWPVTSCVSVDQMLRNTAAEDETYKTKTYVIQMLKVKCKEG